MSKLEDVGKNAAGKYALSAIVMYNKKRMKAKQYVDIFAASLGDLHIIAEDGKKIRLDKKAYCRKLFLEGGMKALIDFRNEVTERTIKRRVDEANESSKGVKADENAELGESANDVSSKDASTSKGDANDESEESAKE